MYNARLGYECFILQSVQSNTTKRVWAIEITESEFNILMTKKDPFKDYNTRNKKYNAFVILNKYGSSGKDYTLYVLVDTCNKYHGFKCYCDDYVCNKDYCITWLRSISESRSHFLHIHPEDELDNNKYVIDIPIDDRLNYYMYM